MPGIWNWEFVNQILPRLLRALVVTVEATLLGMVLALVVGLVLALLRRSNLWFVRMPTAGFIEFVRSTPLLVQLFFAFFVLPKYGITGSAFVTGVVVLGIHYATYTSEVYRAGIEGVRSGQWEAATSLSFSTRHTWTRIVLPQAIPPVIPALGNYLVAMFKETPLLAFITVIELLNSAKIICSQTFRCVEPYTLVGALFMLVSYPSAKFVNKLEERFAIRT